MKRDGLRQHPYLIRAAASESTAPTYNSWNVPFTTAMLFVSSFSATALPLSAAAARTNVPARAAAGGVNVSRYDLPPLAFRFILTGTVARRVPAVGSPEPAVD